MPFLILCSLIIDGRESTEFCYRTHYNLGIVLMMERSQSTTPQQAAEFVIPSFVLQMEDGRIECLVITVSSIILQRTTSALFCGLLPVRPRAIEQVDYGRTLPVQVSRPGATLRKATFMFYLRTCRADRQAQLHRQLLRAVSHASRNTCSNSTTKGRMAFLPTASFGVSTPEKPS